MALYTLGLVQTHLHHVLMKTQTHQPPSPSLISGFSRMLRGFFARILPDSNT